ncbi:MAG: ABC transporter ATP-binding protein [Myxococcota bacterium]
MSEASGATAPLLEIENLSKSFETARGPIHVLRNLNLTVRAGERLAILGQSGVGKSTLLHVLGTLDHPTSGRVLFEGRDLFGHDPEELARLRNRSLGFVFQFHHLLPEFSAVENVMMPGLLRAEPPESVRVRAAEILVEVGLAERLDHPVGKLSGGERQRVAVARALVEAPALVFADEPTGNLDPETGHRVADLLLELNASRNAALVVVTHSRELAVRLGRAVVLEDGGLRELDLASQSSAPGA